MGQEELKWQLWVLFFNSMKEPPASIWSWRRRGFPMGSILSAQVLIKTRQEYISSDGKLQRIKNLSEGSYEKANTRQRRKEEKRKGPVTVRGSLKTLILFKTAVDQKMTYLLLKYVPNHKIKCVFNQQTYPKMLTHVYFTQISCFLCRHL